MFGLPTYGKITKDELKRLREAIEAIAAIRERFGAGGE